MLIDTHCHINMMVKKQFDVPMKNEEFEKAKEITTEAAAYNVKKIINIGTSIEETINCIEIAKKTDNNYASVGIHPNDAKTSWKADIEKLDRFASNKEENKVVAIGECGIDLHYPGYDLELQRNVFKAQIELALKHNLPLIVHIREAKEEAMRCLENYSNEKLKAVIHCFSEGPAFAKEILEKDFFIGIGGAVTYKKNDALREVARMIPLEKLLLETDAPFLSPEPHRGKQNSPKRIAVIARFIAKLRNMDLDDFSAQTTKNAMELFKL